ncbi:hypothetical protein AVEN_134656-1 [Araneus ventricosus]|uniref:Endonuclease/exonuclease/phosphatase domain-containing protein n=1 Tax=Araneus ventricosus TaxID=182803 RepID=A0A4Y2F2T9_ARAVE|nr:hypothetical protein AVEN_134656-1 [Araneus ventricosus]
MEYIKDFGKNTLIFGTWNVRGLNDELKKRETLNEIERENVDIIVLTETKLKKGGEEELGRYNHYYSGVEEKDHAQAGVSILIKKDLCPNLKCKAVNERIITAELEIHGQKVKIIGVYWVNESDSKEIKNKFVKKFEEELTNKGCELIILGDFNSKVGILETSKVGISETSKVGISETSEVVGNCGDKECDRNGKRLIRICAENFLKIQNTFFDHEDIHKYTCYQNSSRSLIDYCITRQGTTLKVRDVLACRWLECGTDHIFLAAYISFPVNKNKRKNIQSIAEKGDLKIRKYKTYLLYSKTFKDSYIKEMDFHIDVPKGRSTVEMYNHLKESIHSAAYDVLGIQDKDTFGELIWDKEIKDLRNRRELPFRTTFDSHFDKIPNEVWEGVCTDLFNIERNKRSKKAWSILNEVLNKSNENVINEQPSEDFCRSLFKNNCICVKEFEAKNEDEIANLHRIVPDHTVQIDVIDVQKALDELDDDECPVPDGLSVQLLRNSSDKTKSLLTDLIQEIFNGKELPPEIGEAYISNILKIKNSEKYAIEDGLQVHCIMRIMCFILKEKLEDAIRRNDSCLMVHQLTHLDVTYTLRSLLRRDKGFHFAFINLRQAYFGVEYLKLFGILKSKGIPETLIAVLEHLFKVNSIAVLTKEKLSQKYTLSKGLIEQCNLGPTLLKIYIQDSIKNWNYKNHEKRIKVKYVPCIISNDKVIIVSRSIESLKTRVLNLAEEFKGLGLHISLENLKYLGNKKLKFDGTEIQGKNPIAFDGSCFELNGGNKEEVFYRILETKNAIGYLHPVVRNEKISTENKNKIFNIIIKCILMNGCETWTLTRDLEKSINSLERSYWKWCKPPAFVYAKLMLRKDPWYSEKMNQDKLPVCILNWDSNDAISIERFKQKWVDDFDEIKKIQSESEKKVAELIDIFKKK